MDRIRTQLEVIDERFRGCQGDDWVERLYTGGRWTEGPAYFPGGRYLLFSDIPNDRMLRFDELTGAVGVFRAPAGYSNGNTVDRQGRLVSCEQGHRRVTRTEHDGSVTVLIDRYEASGSTAPTTSSSTLIARSGSPTLATGSTVTTRDTRPSARSALATSTASIPRQARRQSSPTISIARTVSRSLPTSATSTSETPARSTFGDSTSQTATSPPERSSRLAMRVHSTGSGSTKRDGSGRQPTTDSIA